MATNPKVDQGVLNRVRTSLVVASNSALNVTAPYLGKSMIQFSFEGNFAEQIETGTGAVRSPEPYVMTTATINLLRSQSLAATWMNLVTTDSYIGSITGHADSSLFPAITLDQTVVRSIDPGAFDGQDPIVRVVVRGVFYTNNNMWMYA